MPCHDDKSENERLYKGARKTIESTFSRNVLEKFVAAPKPQQLVFGNGKEFSIEIDQIRARSNALMNVAALPIFDILDEIKDFDQIHAEVDPENRRGLFCATRRKGTLEDWVALSRPSTPERKTAANKVTEQQ